MDEKTIKLRHLLVEVRRAQAANDHDYERLTRARAELAAAEKAEAESAYNLQVALAKSENEKSRILREEVTSG